MKTTLAAIAVVALIAGANAMAHGGKCEAGCDYCEDSSDMVTVYDKLKTDATKMVANNATSKHAPFLCKVNSNNRRHLAAHAGKCFKVDPTCSSRRLQAHAVGTFRIAVNYADLKTLHPMSKDHHIDMVQVLDASSTTHNRALQAHASKLLFQKTWAADGDFDEKNPCMDFTLLKAKGITHLQTFEHCNLHGPFMSEKIAVADIPDCQQGMVAKATESADSDATAKSPATTTAVTTAFVIASIFAFLRLF